MKQPNFVELKAIYVAANELMSYLGAEGHVDTRNILTENLMGALHNFDGCDYLQGLRLDAKFTEVLRNENEDENQLQMFMDDESIDSANEEAL